MLSRLQARRRDDQAGDGAATLSTATILRLWWPLAASWLLMGAELPLFTAVVAQERSMRA